MKMLNIGVGNRPITYKDYQVVSLDIRPEVKPDIVGDCRKIPEPDESYDAVYSSHTLEHFGRAEIMPLLLEWLRVLKPGGLLIVVVPNLEFAARDILSGLINSETFDILYGAQEYATNFHKMGFTCNVLKEFLDSIGSLKDIEIALNHSYRPNWEIVAKAIKS